METPVPVQYGGALGNSHPPHPGRPAPCIMHLPYRHIFVGYVITATNVPAAPSRTICWPGREEVTTIRSMQCPGPVRCSSDHGPVHARKLCIVVPGRQTQIKALAPFSIPRKWPRARSRPLFGIDFTLHSGDRSLRQAMPTDLVQVL